MKRAVQQMYELFWIVNETTFNEDRRHVVVYQHAKSRTFDASILLVKIRDVLQCRTDIAADLYAFVFLHFELIFQQVFKERRIFF